MEDFSNSPHLDPLEITTRLQSILDKRISDTDTLARIVGLIDLTTLEGADTPRKVLAMCKKGTGLSSLGLGLPNVAAVCVYPTLVAAARKGVQGSGLKVAAVAGAFPAGQSPIHIKVEEVKYTVDQGADEIDMVISRGAFLDGEYNRVFDEIAAIKQACGTAHLKVILETGELKSPTLIRRASDIAIAAGGDFIKTSTGKIAPAATPEAMLVILDAIKDYHQRTGKMIGIKPAGGIAQADVALDYYTLTASILGEKWLHPDWFRIGASRLVDDIIAALQRD